MNHNHMTYKNSRPEVFCQKGVLKNFSKFTEKQLFQSLFFHKVAGHEAFKKATLAQVFSCEFEEIFKNTFLIEHLWWLLLNIVTKNIGAIDSNYRH